MKVLIVEDSMISREMLSKIITNLGHEVIGEAESGKEAFEKYKELKPDLVTMDISMPESDGLEGLKLIKDFDTDAKVIMITAMSQRHILVNAFELGAKGFITKPFEEEEVIKTLKKFN